ncbi:TPA: hypothetical protein L4F64_004434 [Pseudomonas aeruginosa]|nr:hypothetical protein Y31_3007 [Pseudomonas aeruginosa]HBM65160.1 hypothetical protein [Pseudomonas sp.]KSS01151.1 hypothetical protein APB52_02220 [Pseudomonas aeruginosa]MBG6487900.1 hypothetical protein [Pseudomonas aeruginosa]MBV5983036.1 hypothetical protein [Pseudomonas aeruginosa]
MPLPYDILRLFTSPQGYLVEIGSPKRQPDAPEPVREWLWVTGQSVTSLQLLHTNDDMRAREARLRLDGPHAQLAWPKGEQFTLTASSVQELPALQHQLIHNHLS